MRQCMDSENLHRRLKKIIGQVQAIDRMVDEDIPCEDILAQINAAKSALHRVGQVVLEGHIHSELHKGCGTLCQYDLTRPHRARLQLSGGVCKFWKGLMPTASQEARRKFAARITCPAAGKWALLFQNYPFPNG